MKGTRFLPRINKHVSKTLNSIYISKQPSKWIFVLLVIVHLLASSLTTIVATSHNSIVFLGNTIPIQVFAGAFSSLANLCIIFLVVFFRKYGFITAIAVLALQFPRLIVSIFLHHNMATIQGFFTNALAIVACIVIYLNKTEIEKYQSKFRHEAVTDTLTGLPNRFACTEVINNFIKNGFEFTLVSIDLNNFKSINDTMGHEIGDKVLIEIASRWKALMDSRQTKTIDFIARLGGDEFALVIMGYFDSNGIHNTINAYNAELKKTITIDNCDYFMGACFGCAEFPGDASSSTALFSCADAALHEIKRLNSSNCIMHYSSELLKTEQLLEIERKLRTALDNDDVLFYLQPQYDASHKLRGFEALARIKDTDGSFLRPDEFIPIAEKAGLIDRVDIQVFRKAAFFMRNVLKNSDKDVIMSVNISVRHLMKNNFMDEIKGIISSSGVPANHFEIEITESIMIDSAEKALKRIDEIKQMGFKIAIDDFGTGYSSLSYLNKFPADSLKIDKSFIDEMNSSDSSKQYVATIISIGHTLNLKVISEGVEEQDQLETLRSIGGDYIQGFIWGKPMPPEEAANLV